MPEELWMEVHNIVQEAVIKIIPKKKKLKKAKWLSMEVLQIAMKRREAKRKGEKTSLPFPYPIVSTISIFYTHYAQNISHRASILVGKC